jgi:hypothetical protein
MSEVAGSQPECLRSICRDWPNRIHLLRSHHSLDNLLGFGGVAFGDDVVGEHRLTPPSPKVVTRTRTPLFGAVDACALGRNIGRGQHRRQALQNPLCFAAALFAMAFLSGSASASPIGSGTRAAVPPQAVLLQEARCQRLCRPQDRVCDRFSDGRMVCRPAACRVTCRHR